MIATQPSPTNPTKSSFPALRANAIPSTHRRIQKPPNSANAMIFRSRIKSAVKRHSCFPYPIPNRSYAMPNANKKGKNSS
ncbi:hypothetical protein VTL71DRAFT_12092 [Oculimacula yallundae]|uniref:Uncharacterized protein n=1 Tax=Oculimacula yallundae TaxID=86028 RepID=A0ABR4CS98_9HELO